jgi:ABC-2 type transport system permease protein
VNLALAELSRLTARRVTVAMGVIIVGLLAVIAMGFFVTSSPPSTQDYQRAREIAAGPQQAWDANRRQCLRVESGAEPANGAVYPPNCDYGPRPTPETYLAYGFTFSRQWPGIAYTFAIILAVFGFVVGSSFVGAEWTSGGMTNLLLWRPKRMTVLGTKYGVALGATIAVSIAYLALGTGVFLIIAALRGTIGHVPVGSFLFTDVRAVGLAAFGAAVGFTLASIGRHTSIALGVAVGYLLVYELGSLIIFDLVDVSDHAERLRLSTYAVAFLNKGYTLSGGGYSCEASGACYSTSPPVISWYQGGLVLLVVSAVLLGVAMVTMQRRDLN